MSSRVPREHLALVFRHGDRTPIFNSHEPLGLESTLEAVAWALSLTTKTFERNLDSRFPVDAVHSAPTRDKVGLGKTFGCLTSMGALQMRRLGRIISPNHPISPRRVWSSNFTRTQFSLQCLLAGLAPLATNAHIHVGREILNIWGTDPTLRRLLKSGGAIGTDITSMVTKEEDEAKRVFTNAIPAFAYQIRPFSWMSALDFAMCREGKTGGGGILRGRPNPAKQLELFGEMCQGGDVISTESFKTAMSKVFDCPFADAELLNRLIDRDGSGTIDLAEMKLFFESIRLPNPSGGVTERELFEASKVVERAVCQRFDHILSQPAIRRISCGGVAKTILDGLDDALRSPHPEEPTTIDLYSAHDVTLIPLIKHLGIWNGTRNDWPGVSSALLFRFAGNRVRVQYWEGVRGGASGLEAHTMQLKPVDLTSFEGGGGGSDGDVDLDAFRRWAQQL